MDRRRIQQLGAQPLMAAAPRQRARTGSSAWLPHGDVGYRPIPSVLAYVSEELPTGAAR